MLPGRGRRSSTPSGTSVSEDPVREEQLPAIESSSNPMDHHSSRATQPTTSEVPQILIEQMCKFQERMMETFLNKLAQIQPFQPIPPTAATISQKEILTFSEFDEDKVNPKLWLKSADLIMADRLSEAPASLARALIAAMKGNACTWLSDNLNNELTWEKFRELFSQEYCFQETPAAVIHKTLNTKIKHDMLKQSKAQLEKLRRATQDVSKDDVLINIVASMCAMSEPDLEKWIYREGNITEAALLKEIKTVQSQEQTPVSEYTPNRQTSPPQRSRTRKGPSSMRKRRQLKRFAETPSSAPDAKQRKLLPEAGSTGQQSTTVVRNVTVLKNGTSKVYVSCELCKLRHHTKETCYKNPNSVNYRPPKSPRRPNGNTSCDANLIGEKSSRR
uniref:Uncharacterized protein n=1 Tax=Lygus hesperus TaxID=30085 RepID=A0A146MD60_LYGHE